MPYLVQAVALPSVTVGPNGAPSPQLQQLAVQLNGELNALEQSQGFRLDQIVEAGSAALLIFKR